MGKVFAFFIVVEERAVEKSWSRELYRRARFDSACARAFAPRPSVDFDPGSPDHLLETRTLRAEERGELLGGVLHRQESVLEELVVDRGRLERAPHGGGDALDHLARRSPGGHQAEPDRALDRVVAALGQGRDSRQGVEPLGLAAGDRAPIPDVAERPMYSVSAPPPHVSAPT